MGTPRMEASVIEFLDELLHAGMTTRDISERLEIGRTYIELRLRKMRASGEMPACACGREWRHRGWCTIRLKGPKSLPASMSRWSGNKPVGGKA